jgi:hypothetical protein
MRYLFNGPHIPAARKKAHPGASVKAPNDKGDRYRVGHLPEKNDLKLM